jgi:hypothetical protein
METILKLKFRNMIEIVKKSKGKKVEPHYLLKYNYMIGDADGNTNEKVKVSLNNPYLERYVTLLNSLQPCKGTWGLILDTENITKVFKEGQITEDDYRFLTGLMFEYWEDEESEPYFKENDKYSQEFYDGVEGETEYSFLVFEGVKLYYIDENGDKFDTIIK